MLLENHQHWRKLLYLLRESPTYRPTGGRNCCAMKKQLCGGNYCTMKEPPTYRWMKELYPLGNQRHTGEETVASCENNYVEETIIP